MEESIEEIKLLLKEMNSTPETIKSVKIVGNYSLNRNDVSAQVIDWVFHFLEEKCPYNLAVAIAKETAKQVTENISEQQLKEENINQGNSLNSLTLYNETMKKLGFVWEQFASEIALNKMDTFRSPFKSSVFAIKNKRRKMEDRHVIHSDLNLLLDLKNAPTHSYYAVYDGHSGVDAASFASAHLHINIANHPDFLTDPRLAILEGYKITDVNFSRMCVEENIKSGTTAICALIRESTLFLSWVGDSQAVLVKEGKPVIVTSPHKPDREDERTRIEDLGGCITYMGTWRVNGMLAVTRALGDFDHRPYVSNEPEIDVRELDGTEDFLILACDGLWDGMSPEDVIPALYYNLLERAADEPLDTVAAKLVHQSKLQGSEDNITVIVVFLRDINIIRENAAKYVPNLSKANLSQNIFELNGEKGCMESVFNSQIQKPTVLELNNSSMKKLKNAANVLSAAGIGDSLTYSFSENSECSSYSNMEINSEYSAALIAPETTALSELPTPPIDDVLASQQFEKELDSAVYDSDASLSKISSNVVSSSDCDMKELSQSEEFEFSQKETILQEEKLSPEEALDLASNVVSSTIETAVKCVSEKESSETSLHVTTQKLNPYAEPFVMKSFIPSNFNSNDSDVHSDLTISPKPTQAQFELKSEISESNVNTILLSENKEQSAVEDHSNVLSMDSEANIINIKDSVETQCQLIDTEDKASLESSKSDINSPILESSGIDFDCHKSAETLEETLTGSAMSPDSQTNITDDFAALSLSTKDGDLNLCVDTSKTETQIDMKFSDEIFTNRIENLIEARSDFISDVEPMDIDVPEEKSLKCSSENLEDFVYISKAVDKDVSTQEEKLENEANKDAENTVVETIKSTATDIENTTVQTTSLIEEKNLDYTNEITENLMNLSVETGNNIESSISLKDEILNFANENVKSSLNISQTIKNVTDDTNVIVEPISLMDEKSEHFTGDNISNSFTVSENIEKEAGDENTNVNSTSLIEQKLLDFSMEHAEKCFNIDQNIENEAPNENIIKLDDQNEMLFNYTNENTDHLVNVSEVIENKVTNKNIVNVEGQNIEKLSDTNENTENLAIASDVIESKTIIDENILQVDNVDKDNSFFNINPESKSEGTSLTVQTADNLAENNSFLSVSEMEQDGSFLSDLITDTNETSFQLAETLNDITSFSESANGLVPDPSVILKEMSLPLVDMKDNLLSPAAILPSDHSDEVAIEPVAVDLQSIPVGVPEAEGVTEDIDSDSEKDGGWSYMKGNTIGGVKQKVAASKSKVGKYGGTKLDTVKPKEMPKAATESKIKVKTVSNIDKTKKIPLEKKLPDNKEKSKLTKAMPPPTTKVAAEKQSRIMQTGIKKDIPASKGSTLLTNKVPRAPIAPRNPQIQVKSASITHTNRTQPISKPLPTTATARPKPNIDTKTSATSSLPKKQLPTQTIKSTTITSARLTMKRSATATVPPKATSTMSTLQKAISTEAKIKPATTSLKRTLPPALKKPDVKETKELSNKQISEKKVHSLPKTSRAALPTSTTSSLRSTIPSSNAKPISKPRSAPLRNETLKKDVPKTQISRLAAKSSTQSKLTKDPIKSKVSAAEPKKLVEKESKVAPTEKSEIVPPSEEEKFLREVNDKEIPSKEQVDSAVSSVQEPEKMQNGCVAQNESREVEIISSPMETLL